MCKCADVQMCKCADVQMCKCADVQMCRCADVQMCRCADEIDNLSNYKLKFNLMLHFEQLTPAFAHLHICTFAY